MDGAGADEAVKRPLPARECSAFSAMPKAAGLTERHDEILAELGIKTVGDLGSNKYFATAGVLVALSGHID